MRVTTLIAVLLLSACGAEDRGDGNCREFMDRVRSSWGPPEEVETYRLSGTRSESWWYWSRGYEVTFFWGDGVFNCETSEYTFEPIRG